MNLVIKNEDFVKVDVDLKSEYLCNSHLSFKTKFKFRCQELVQSRTKKLRITSWSH